MGIFFINLGPSSGIVPVNAVMYEHWLYFSLLGAGIVLSYYGLRLFDNWSKRSQELKVFLIIIMIGYGLFLGVQAIQRNLLWGNIEKMYLNILRYEPDNVRVLNNLANLYMDYGQIDEAQGLYIQATKADPYQPAPYYNLGNIARDSGQLDQAEELYKKSISVDPRFHYAYSNLAALYIQQHRFTEAISILEELKTLQPSADIEKIISDIKKRL